MLPRRDREAAPVDEALEQCEGTGVAGSGREGRRNILISVLGTSPAIVTETLYALTVQEGIPVHEVHVWTTTTGRERAEAALRRSLDEGAFYRLYRDYGMDAALPSFDVRVFRDGAGRELDDIRSKEDNAAMLDHLVGFIRDKAARPEHRLLCSLAGGRKTMSTALALALQLHGRPGDRLFHVLVNPPELETIPEFFYPPPSSQTFVDRTGLHHDSAAAIIELADLPIVFLQEHLPRIAHNATGLSYTELVRVVQKQLLQGMRPPSVRVSPGLKGLDVGGKFVELQPRQLALYATLASRRLRCPRGAEHETDGELCPECSISSSALVADNGYATAVQEEMQRWLDAVPARAARAGELHRWGPENDPKDRVKAVSETASRIRSRIRKGLGPGAWAQTCQIVSEKSPETTLYGLTLPPSRIALETGAAG